MLDLLRRISNRNAIPVTQKLSRIYEKKSSSGFTPDLIKIAKLIYKEAILDIKSGIDKKRQQDLFFLIDNIEFNEQVIVDYLKSSIWSYGSIIDKEIEGFLQESDDIMSQIGE